MNWRNYKILILHLVSQLSWANFGIGEFLKCYFYRHGGVETGFTDINTQYDLFPLAQPKNEVIGVLSKGK